MKDDMGRSINYLRISVTEKCNLKCRYCMPEGTSCGSVSGQELSDDQICRIVEAGADLGITKLRLTGGEPLLRKNLPELISRLSRIPGIKEIGLTTNGTLLADHAMVLKVAGLQSVNISLDTLDEEKYRRITGGGSLKSVLEGINAAEKAGLRPLKLNTVLIGSFNEDEIEDFVELTRYSKIDVRFIELMPMGKTAQWARRHYISNDFLLNKFKDLQPITGETANSTACYYQLPGAWGRVGLINPMSHSFCGSCNRIRLISDGKLKPCLHGEEEINLMSCIENTEALAACIEKAIFHKPAQHMLHKEGGNPVVREMFRIGG